MARSIQCNTRVRWRKDIAAVKIFVRNKESFVMAMAARILTALLPVQSFTYRHSARRGRSGNKVSRHHDMAPLLSRRRHDLGAVSRRVGGRLPNVCLQAHSGCSRLVACRRCSDRGGGRRHRVRGPGGHPRKPSRQQPIKLGLRARAVALRMPMAGTAGEADLHSWSAAGLKRRLEKRCPFS